MFSYIKKKLPIFFALFLFFAYTLIKLQTASAQTPTTVSYQVTSGEDDGYDVAGSNTFTTATPVFAGGKDVNGNVITAGFRFTNVAVPQGATIQSATIDWQESWSGNYQTFVKTNIFAEASDSSLAFSSSSLPRGRTRTTAFATYNSASEAINSGVWMSATTSNRPPDIGQVIQEVVNRPGWNSGNALSIIMSDNASSNDWWWEFRSFEFGAANAPKLTITYTTTSATPTLIPPTPTSTPIIPTNTPTPTPTATPAAYFSIGAGYDDNLTRQLVRTNTDKLYIFAATVASQGLIKAYWSNTPGLPNASTDINGTTLVTNPSAIVSVDAVYDGGNIIHVLVNDMSRTIKDYPFDLTNNTFKPSLTIANDGGIPALYSYIGTVGISGMFDINNTLHITYWNNANHITYQAYTYDALSNSLTLTPGSTTQVDLNGNANHPQLVVSPVDNSITVAWVNGQDGAGTMSARSKPSGGTWGTVEAVSNSAVWTSPNSGINIDQGPSIVITFDGTKHLIYMENFGSCGSDYGRIHYVKKGPSDTAWTDQSILNFCSHAPGIATDATNGLYILGHGHPVNPTCTRMEDMCYIKRNSVGTWDNPVIVAVAPGSESYDSSASIKWSVVGWNRPETIEFLFFKTPYSTPLLYYGRLDTPGGTLPTNTPTPTPAYTLSGTVYVDTNQNGVQDPGEVGYSNGTTVTLSTVPPQTRITDTSGNYSFVTIPASTYDVTLTVPLGYAATTTNPVLNLPLAANTTQNFGINVAPTSTLTPTPTNTPTPTITPTPTNTPIPTPTPVGPSTLTRQITVSADDVNQTNNSLDANSSTVWLGTAQPNQTHYTGLRFTNLNIPKGAVIQNAYLEVYSTQSQWLTIGFTIFAHNIGNSPTFSSSDNVSGRSLTTNQVAHSSNVNWSANTWYQLNNISTVVQEIVNRSDWQSGNSMSIILRGTGGAWGRKFVRSYDGSAANATRLIITYK